MKKILLLLGAAAMLSCATKPLEFFPVGNISFANAIAVININDFEKLAYKTKSRMVYYTDDHFFVQLDGVLYSHISRGYKSFREYREGRLKEPEEWSIFKPGYSE
ncbi:MAG: hypothetical protein Ta2G_10810 [Termitinemataceae bacterium]|nr:MAG: hypothetical protein Ta2G_10810 [Termitinemataceae bacterium]